MGSGMDGTTEGRGRRPTIARFVPITLIAIVALAGLTLFRDTLTFETLSANREALLAWRDANLLLASATYMIVYVLVIAFSLPGGAVMTMTGGFLFGVAAGTAMTVVSATIGASLIFLAAKVGFGDALHRRLVAGGGSGLLRRLEEGLSANAFSYLLLVRLMPVFPFALVNLAPAFLGVSLGTYVAATFLGIIPGTAVYSWIGAGLGEVFDRGETPDLGLIFEPMILGPILGLCALAALPIVVRNLRGWRSAS
jgi:uncharacterized membrane protein YdjX (TVP38/TMEM64 family)